jgi:(4S)-4-hydroxy-5-phosphonooxypentane-2,3-dione isomerase
MGAYVVIVDFRIRPGAKSEFRRLIDANARASCRHEPGCRRFDVLECLAEADRILLYEIYDDRAAFEAHAKTDHYATFNQASAPYVAGKEVVVCDLVCESSVDLSPQEGKHRCTIA